MAGFVPFMVARFRGKGTVISVTRGLRAGRGFPDFRGVPVAESGSRFPGFQAEIPGIFPFDSKLLLDNYGSLD